MPDPIVNSVATFSAMGLLGIAFQVPPPPLWSALPLAIVVTAFWIWWDLRKAVIR